MKKALLALIVFVGIVGTTQAQQGYEVKTNGIYMAKINEVSVLNKVLETWNYLRFFEDGTVLSYTASSKLSADEAAPFLDLKAKKFESQAKLKQNIRTIDIQTTSFVNASEMANAKDHWKGAMGNNNQLHLMLEQTRNAETVQLTAVYSFSEASWK